MFINVHMVALSFRFTKLSVQCAPFNHESFILCMCLCTILGHPSVEGSGEPTSKDRSTLLGPGHYVQDTPRFAVVRLWPLLPFEWMVVLLPRGDVVSIGVV